jgi:zinc transport system permease protein
MTEFLNALGTYTFMQNALLTGILAGVACGIVGAYVVSRRITYIGGGIAHSVLAGMGAAYFLSSRYHIAGLHPLLGAVLVALVAAVVIALISLRTREREDTAISAVWAVGMAAGIIFISMTPGYNEDLMSYLFGNILMVSGRDLWLLGILDIIIVAVGLLFYNKLMAVCFDEEFARIRGINVEFYYLLLLCLTALTVVLLVTVVGIIMVIALLTLPAAIAGKFTRTLFQTMVTASVISILLTVLGLAASYRPNLPPGPVIILLAGIAYVIVSIATGRLRKKMS